MRLRISLSGLLLTSNCRLFTRPFLTETRFGRKSRNPRIINKNLKNDRNYYHTLEIAKPTAKMNPISSLPRRRALRYPLEYARLVYRLRSSAMLGLKIAFGGVC